MANETYYQTLTYSTQISTHNILTARLSYLGYKSTTKHTWSLKLYLEADEAGAIPEALEDTVLTIYLGNSTFKPTIDLTIDNNQKKLIYSNDIYTSSTVTFGYTPLCSFTIKNSELGISWGPWRLGDSHGYPLPYTNSNVYKSQIQSLVFANDENNPIIDYYSYCDSSANLGEITQIYVYATAIGDTEVIIEPSNIDLDSATAAGDSLSGTAIISLTSAQRNKLVSKFPNTKTADLKFYLVVKVYRNDSDIRTIIDEAEVSCSIINAEPDIAPHIEVTDGKSLDLTGNPDAIIADVSDVYYEIGAIPRKGATIVSQYVTCDGFTQYLAAGSYEKVHNPRFTFTVIDSRGNSASKIVDQTYVPYFPVTCNLRTDSVAVEDTIATSKFVLNGKFYNGSFGSTHNNLYIEYRYKVEDGSFNDWRTSTPQLGEDSYLAHMYISEHYQSTIIIEVKVYDSITQRELTQTYIAEPIFDWSNTDFNFNVPVYIKGDLTVTGSITSDAEKNIPYIEEEDTFSSGTGTFYYRKWSDGVAECWGSKDFSVNVTTAWGSMYTTGAISGSNITFPTGLFTVTPNIQVSLRVRSAGGLLMAPGGAGSNIANKSQTGVYEIARGTSLSGAAYTIDYYVRGQWQ